MQYLVAFWSRPEVAINVEFGVAVEWVGVDVRNNLVILGQTVLGIFDLLAHFVMDDEQRRPTVPVVVSPIENTTKEGFWQSSTNPPTSLS